MTARQFFLPYPTAFNSNGLPSAGAKIYFYLAGTNTPIVVYSDAGLTVPTTNPIVADGAGRFDLPYMDDAQLLRVDIRDKNGSLLTEIDNYRPGTIIGSVIGTGGTVVATRDELAALEGSVGTPVGLSESGREGTFFWDASDLSDEVTADVYQGIYVAPVTDTTGASGAWVRSIGSGPWMLSWFGIETGASSMAARFESAIALGHAINGRGTWLLLPNDTVVLDAQVCVDYPVIIDGFGKGTSAATSGSVLEFGGGNNLFRVRSGTEAGNGVGGFGSKFDRFWVEQTSASSAQGAGSYDGAQAVTLTSGSANFANGQVVLVEGASTPVQLPDRTYATTSGSASITCTVSTTDLLGGTPYLGNRVGYEGMHVTGTGIPAGTTFATLGIGGSATLSANATATNSAIALTIVPPIIAQIQSGGGTANLVIDNPTYGAACSSRVVRHCPAAFYISTGRVVVGDVYVNMSHEGAGVVVQGNTAAGQISDFCDFSRAQFSCADFNMVFQGSDANAFGIDNCVFDSAKVHILDNSEFGGSIKNPRISFNLGILVCQITSQTSIDQGYFESGTTWIAPIASLCSAYDVVSMVDGSGWAVARSQSATRILGQVYAKWLDVFAGINVRGTPAATFSNGFSASFVGQSPTANVPFLKIGQRGNGNGNWVTSSAQNSSGYDKLHLEGSEIWFGASDNAADLAKLTTTALNLPTGSAYKINSVQVVGARITGWTAATGTPARGAFAAAAAGTASAAYTQSELQGALNRIAALEARLIAYDADLRTHGLIGT